MISEKIFASRAINPSVSTSASIVLSIPNSKLLPTNVSLLLTAVKRTIRGDFGNGNERVNALGNHYNEVMDQVNKNYKNGTTNWDNIRIY